MKLNIRTLSIIALAAISAAFTQACQPSRAKAYNARTNVDVNGVAFIKDAHEGGLTEIMASKVALKNSANKAVTDFAAMMIKDHTEAGALVDTLAGKKYVFVRDSLNYYDKGKVDSLAKKTGAAFDKAYMAMMVTDHELTVDLMKEGEESNYTDIRQLAEDLLPKIEGHLKAAKSINGSLK